MLSGLGFPATLPAEGLTSSKPESTVGFSDTGLSLEEVEAARARSRGADPTKLDAVREAESEAESFWTSEVAKTLQRVKHALGELGRGRTDRIRQRR